MHTTTLEPGSAGAGVSRRCDMPARARSGAKTVVSGQNQPGTGQSVARTHQKGGRRDQRFGLLATLQAITTLPRVNACGWRRVSKHVPPQIAVADGVAHVQGTQRCGSVWQCPVCGPKIRQGRAEELDAVLLRWITAHGAGTVQLWTLTQPHTSGETLADLRGTIKAAWKQICSGRQWQAMREEFAIAFNVTALDVTHGPNGWHPHLHVIVLTRTGCDDEAVARIRQHVAERWERALVQRGRAKPHPVHGVQIERARSRADVGRYLCQVIGETDDDTRGWSVAQETARTDLKTSHHTGHRTPWQILGDIRKRRAHGAEWDALDEERDTRDCALWREYEISMKGARAVSFSKGLRAAVGIETPELTDEELAAQEIGGTVVARIESRREWLAVRLTRGGMVRLLRVAENHSEKGVRRLLATMLARKRNHPLMIRQTET